MTDRISRRQLLGARRRARRRARASAGLRAQAQARWWPRPSPAPGTRRTATYLAPAFTKAQPARRSRSRSCSATIRSPRLTAAKGGKPPFDVVLFDRPQVLDAAKQGLIVEYPAAQVAELQGPDAGVPGQVGPAHLDADDRHRLQSEEDQDAAEVLGRRSGTRNTRVASASPRSTASSASPSWPRSTACAAAARTNFEPAFKALRGAAAECRRDRRQSRRLRHALAAGADRHRAVQLQLRPDPEGQGRAGRVRRSRRPARSAGPPACTSSPTPPSPTSRCKYIDTHLDPAVQSADAEAALRRDPDQQPR